MTKDDRDRLSERALLALTLIGVIAIVLGIWGATVNGREVEGIVAVVAGVVSGIVAIVLRDNRAD